MIGTKIAEKKQWGWRQNGIVIAYNNIKVKVVVLILKRIGQTLKFISHTLDLKRQFLKKCNS